MKKGYLQVSLEQALELQKEGRRVFTRYNTSSGKYNISDLMPGIATQQELNSFDKNAILVGYEATRC